MKNLITLFALLAGHSAVAAAIGEKFTVAGTQQAGHACPHYYIDPDCSSRGAGPEENAWDVARTVCLPNTAAKVSAWRPLNPRQVVADFICISPD